MIRADRELLATLAAVNSDVAPVAMRIMDGSATATEQRVLGQRLQAAGVSLIRRAEPVLVIDGDADPLPEDQ